MAQKKKQPSKKVPAIRTSDQLSLRERAERKLKTVHHEKIGKLSQAEILKLVHELQTHQIELEIQNEELRNAHAELDKSRLRYSSLFNFAPVGYFTFNSSLLTQEANFTAAQMLGRNLPELYRTQFLNVVAKQDRGIFLDHMDKVKRFYKRHNCEVRIRRKDGFEFYAALESVIDEETEETVIRTAIVDITDRKKAEAAIRQQADLLNLTQDTIIIRDMNDVILFWNRGAEELYGWYANEAQGKISHELLRTRFPEPLEKINDQLQRSNKWQGELTHKKRDGSEVVVSSRWALQRNGEDRPAAVMEINTDITQKKNMEDKIRFQADHDALTTLPNRRRFLDHVWSQINHAKRNREKMGVLFLDLDRFKVINDTLGHAIGDRILQAVSERLRDAMRQSDIIARIGGDEFAVVAMGINAPEDAGLIAEKILACFTRSFYVDNRDFYLSSSIGISMYPADGEHPDVLLKNADIAMYQAKQSGRSNYQFFNADMNARSLERMMLENSLRQMLNRGELVVHYQPQINTLTGEITGAEALARWKHPELGLLNPVRFIPLAEETGLIAAIDEWVLRTACFQSMDWRKNGAENLSVTVNLSANRFHRAGMVEMISRILKDCGLDPRLLEIEITESVAMQDTDATYRNLKDLRGMGVNMAIDDFGTGYSSLSHLKKLPIRKLKIDKSFIAGLPNDPDSRAIVTAILAMAHSMKLTVVAEGVETEQQRDILKSLGCDELQGYLIKKPVPAEEFGKMMLES